MVKLAIYWPEYCRLVMLHARQKLRPTSQSRRASDLIDWVSKALPP